MANSFVQVPPDSTGKNIDAASLDVGATAVQRQRIVIGDNSATAEFAIIAGGAMTIAGTVNISSMPAIPIGTVNNISATVVIAGIVSFAANQTLGQISATVGVKGQISLAAGTANIGTINDISRTVQVAIGTPFIIDSISATVGVKGQISLAAGTANIGFINNISATVVIAGAVTFTTGQVSLAAGTSNIGIINNISATVVTGLSYVIEKTSNSQVQVGDSLNAAVRVNVVAGAAGGVSQIDGTSFTSQAANFVPIGGMYSVADNSLSDQDAGVCRMTSNRSLYTTLFHTGGTAVATNTPLSVAVERISATAAVILAAGTANFGTLNNISATVVMAGTVSFGPGTAGVGNFFINAQPAQYSASRGPKTVVVSTSVGVVLVAAPAVAEHVYVTMLGVTNASSTLTRADIFAASQTGSMVCRMVLAASGGGFVMHYDPPIKLNSATQLTCRVKPNVSECFFNVHFYVGT